MYEYLNNYYNITIAKIFTDLCGKGTDCLSFA